MFNKIALLLSFCFLAACGGGGGSGASFSPPVGGEALLAVPTEFKAAARGVGESAWVDLSWNAVSGASGYRIYRDGELIATIAGGDTASYKDADGDLLSRYAIESFTVIDSVVIESSQGDGKPVDASGMLPDDAFAALWEIAAFDKDVAAILQRDGEISVSDLLEIEDIVDEFKDYQNLYDEAEIFRASLPQIYKNRKRHIVGAVNNPVAHSGDGADLYSAGSEVAFPRHDGTELLFPKFAVVQFKNACIPDGVGECNAVRDVNFGYSQLGSRVFSFFLPTRERLSGYDIQFNSGYALYGANLDIREPQYAILGQWNFYHAGFKRHENFPEDGGHIPWRNGFSIFGDNTVKPPDSGTARYDVGAYVKYNEPVAAYYDSGYDLYAGGDYDGYHIGAWGWDIFHGRLAADFGAGTIAGRLTSEEETLYRPTRIVTRHLDFNGKMSDACEAAACFSGTVTAAFEEAKHHFWKEGFIDQTGEFTGAFYDDPDSYDGKSAPREIGGVFGGLFNEDGGELVGGFLGGLADDE